MKNNLSDLRSLLLFLNPEKLTDLKISDNNFIGENLSVFNDFVNLRTLWIGGDNEKHFAKGIHNKFSGSLEPLKNLTYLEELYIDNTDINQGIEYLPDCLEEICYSTEARPESKLKKIVEELKWWESINHSFIPKVKKEWENKGFDYEKTKEWIGAGLKAEDLDYAQWLRDIKKKDAKWLSDESNKEKLRKEYIDQMNNDSSQQGDEEVQNESNIEQIARVLEKWMKWK